MVEFKCSKNEFLDDSEQGSKMMLHIKNVSPKMLEYSTIFRHHNQSFFQQFFYNQKT
jgi:hypothetical protein